MWSMLHEHIFFKHEHKDSENIFWKILEEENKGEV